jgi:ligand-binding sensor domain-containing protein
MDRETNGLELIVEGLQSLMELIGLFITLQILACLITWVRAIAIDEEGNIWIGTAGQGLVKFDGVNWTVYNTSNSGLPDNYVMQ